MWFRLLPWAGWVLAGLIFWFWLGAKEDLAAEVERCNSDKLSAIAEAENITRLAERKAAQQRLAQVEQVAEKEKQAREIAEDAAELAEAGQVQQQMRIRELELEASIDDIPDSNECLNVFVPGRVLPAEDCGETGSGGDSRAGGTCESTEGTDSTDSAFSDITYGDSMKIWGKDRVIIGTLNGQLKAIESLGNE